MARNRSQQVYPVHFVSVECSHDGRLRLIGALDKKSDVVFEMSLLDGYSLITGLRRAFKNVRGWLNQLEGLMTSPIKHEGPTL
jgi:hypothetical protein